MGASPMAMETSRSEYQHHSHVVVRGHFSVIPKVAQSFWVWTLPGWNVGDVDKAIAMRRDSSKVWRWVWALSSWFRVKLVFRQNPAGGAKFGKASESHIAGYVSIFFTRNIPISQQMSPSNGWKLHPGGLLSFSSQGKKLRQFCIEKWIWPKLIEKRLDLSGFWLQNQGQIRIFTKHWSSKPAKQKSTNWCNLTKASARLKQKVWVRPLNQGIPTWRLTENSVPVPLKSYGTFLDPETKVKMSWFLRLWQWLGTLVTF